LRAFAGSVPSLGYSGFRAGVRSLWAN